MKKLLFVIFLFPFSTQANCIGTEDYYSCSDSRTGNQYSVTKFGDTTYMQGNNPRTGARWTQESYDWGNGFTTHNGRDKNGNSWSTTCGAFGCN